METLFAPNLNFKTSPSANLITNEKFISRGFRGNRKFTAYSVVLGRIKFPGHFLELIPNAILKLRCKLVSENYLQEAKNYVRIIFSGDIVRHSGMSTLPLRELFL